MEPKPPRSQGPSAWESVKDAFPFGIAPFLILLLTVVSGLFLLAVTVFHGPAEGKAGLSMWTFARQHYVAYEKARPSFERKYATRL
ncbi:MAG TPA: hypothetical protein VM031_02985, partial [Phycisphaerae bacterium]|nr:hypothetical protein [Phycisphaerae bacterium]